ncbi:1-acyl-sn-glycerol-3-phosphate acyltransferase BAT2, chloroplastic-like isoform X1 [Henckelia pumila]|uniref:1-acyl-sn-glycerol-3-phosphate acyltransferase BAT2, chloroplastic-like isoform X1 n=1 Tax=Henckelia pumila TaxID=405737 RepID=UPI003C6DC2C0
MELSLQLSRIHFPTVSSSPLHPSKRVHGFFAPSRSLGSGHGSCFGRIRLSKRPNQRFSSNCCLPHEARFDLRRTFHPPQSSLYDEPGSSIMCNGCACQRWDKLSRDVVVRSELAGTGSTQDMHAFSEIWSNSKVRGICFYAITAFAAIILFVPMFLEHPFVLMFDRYRRKVHYLVAKTWAFLTVAPFVKIEYEGLENLPATDTPAVYVSNHQSFLDIYALLTLGKCFKFISKTSVFLYPIIGWAMFLLGVIPLKRMDSKSQFDCLKQCMALIKKGASVFFFPEGTRSKDGKLGPFKKGAFSVAAKTGVPIVPISLIGTGEIMPPGFEGRLNPGSLKIIVHPSIVGNNPDTLCTEARNLIASGLN